MHPRLSSRLQTTQGGNPPHCDALCLLLQFGKVDANTYIMDFNPTIVSAAQAFAVSLSTFDTKVLL